MKILNKARYTLDEIREKVVPVAKKYGVEKIWLFGSYARGDADEKSDVDFLIDRGKIRGLQYFGFVLDLEEIFKCHVDVVSINITNKKFLDEIGKDEVLIYAEETA